MVTEQLSVAPLIVIVGVTASGKSKLALKLAKELGGEIICADSRTIYKGMDIGTAKPSKSEQAEVKHHLLDVVTPDTIFTAAMFKQRASLAITDCHTRGVQPFLVGGSGLYIDGLLFNYAFGPSVEIEERSQLEQLTITDLQQRIIEKGLALPNNPQNPHRLIRVIESNGAVPVRSQFRGATLMLGLDRPKVQVVEQIIRRVDMMLDNGLKQEVTRLKDQYGWTAAGLNAVGYKEWQPYFAGTKTVDDVRQDIIRNSVHYAKRQRTWFRRNEHIQWVTTDEQAEKLVQAFITNQRK